MFSPYYAHARRHAGDACVDPLDHCAQNVALYGPRGSGCWAMTERSRHHLERDATSLRIGPSAVRWQPDGTLTIDIEEITVPWPARMRGRVRLHPGCRLDQAHALDAQGMHSWCPIAPIARVEVEMERPRLRWAGDGYLDMNRGHAPLESEFARWNWSRAMLPDSRCAVLYDVQSRHAPDRLLALQFDSTGHVEAFDPPPVAPLPSSRWGVGRTTRSDRDTPATLVRSFEDGPFYARALVSSRIAGRDCVAMHESLSMDRFEKRWVQGLLPFRMPRRPG
ncbi:MAG: carotenoid 1,2-hydratase [Caldimonas sp.]